jgi:hypothetical protein
MKFYLLFGIILLNFLKSVLGGAYIPYDFIQQSPRQDGIYEYYYRFDKSMSDKNKERFLWAIRYIMRESNILFIEPRNPEIKATNVSETGRCFEPPFSISISDDCTMRDIVSQVLISLGIFPEVKRSDDLNGFAIGKSVIFSDSRSSDIYNSVTHFDNASVTNYRKLYFVAPYTLFFFEYLKAVEARILPDTDYFELSSCDWYTLNKMYPGPRAASKCNPGVLPRGLEPSESFIKKVGKEKAYTDCRQRYNTLYETGDCFFKNKEAFPSTQRTLYAKYLPGATLTKDQLDSYCCPFINFKGGILKPNEYDCYKSCKEVCPKKFGNFPVAFCMKYRFLGCIKNVLKSRK